MRRTLIFSLLIVGVAVALSISAYSALAGPGPVTSVAGAVISAGESDDGGLVEDADDVDADDDVDDVDAEDEDGDSGEGDQGVAQAIAETFEVTPDEVMALHDGGVGFGAIFKLHLLSAAGAGTVEELQAAAEEDGGFAFGKHFKELSGEVAALSAGEDGVPKNLGQAVSHAKKGDKGAVVVAIEDGDSEDDGDGPPDHAPARGRR
jgi:hypothetical protein